MRGRHASIGVASASRSRVDGDQLEPFYATIARGRRGRRRSNPARGSSTRRQFVFHRRKRRSRWRSPPPPRERPRARRCGSTARRPRNTNRPASFPAELFADVAEIRVVAVAGQTFYGRSRRRRRPRHRRRRRRPPRASIRRDGILDESGQGIPRLGPIPWTTYRAACSRAALNVMTAFMLRAMHTSATRTRADVDFCSGSACWRRRTGGQRRPLQCVARPSAGGPAAAARLAGCATTPCAVVSSDSWSGLAADETFDVVVVQSARASRAAARFSVLARK